MALVFLAISLVGKTQPLRGPSKPVKSALFVVVSFIYPEQHKTLYKKKERKEQIQNKTRKLLVKGLNETTGLLNSVPSHI